MDITTEMLNQACEMVKGLMTDYHRQIDTAYLNAEGPLAVNLKAQFAPALNGVKILTSISFVKENCKNSISVVVDPKQNELPFPDGTTVSYTVKGGK